jgi:hypothetical protein
MADEEITGKRDLTYSAWHRTIGPECGMIDIDDCEFCRRCYRPLALIEATRDKGRSKPSVVTRKLAELAGIPAWTARFMTDDSGTITEFFVQEICPDKKAKSTRMTAQEFAGFLKGLHLEHRCQAPDGKSQRRLFYGR